MKRAGRFCNTTSKKWKKGEMLIETVISIAVFALVMVAVSGLIAASYHMLSASAEQYEAVEQQCANVENNQDVGEPDRSHTLLFAFDDTAHTADQMEIRIYSGSPIVFFEAGAGD